MTLYSILQVANILLYVVLAGCAIVITKVIRDDCIFYQKKETEECLKTNMRKWLDNEDENDFYTEMYEDEEY